jgi:hypothetical protein
MPPLMQLPAYQINNALLNFQPLNEGVDAYRQGSENVRRFGVAQDAGKAMAGGDYKGAMSTALAGDRPDLAGLAIHAQSAANAQENMSFERTMKMAQMHGAAADRALQSNDPQLMRSTWQRMVGSHPEYGANLQKFGVDPADYNNGLSFVRDQAATHLADIKLKQAEVDNIPTRAAMGKAQLENATLPQFENTGTDRFGQPNRGFVDRRTQTISAPTQVGGQAANNLAPGVGVPTGDDFLKTLDPATATQVRSIAEGKQAFPGGFALKTPYWQKMVEMVSQYDPTFDAVNYNSRNQTRKDFTSGKAAQNITSFNTAIGHLDSLARSVEALDNTDYPMYNRARQFIGEQGGDTKMQTSLANFNTNKNAVIEELTRAFKGAGGSLTEVQMWEHQIDAAKSKPALRAVVKQAVDLLESRIDSMMTQYQKGMGTTATTLPGLTPKAQATIERLKNIDAPQKVQGSLNDAAPASAGGPVAKFPDPPVVASPEDARKLPPGTVFKTPDGRLLLR